MEVESAARKSYQARALFRKSATLQLRQKGTNCCQILTPILCLALVAIMKALAESQLSDKDQQASELASFPRILNPPLVPNFILMNLIPGLKIDSCEQWYYFDIDPEAEPGTEQYVGYLTGEREVPDNTTRSGLLGSIPNFMCRSNMKNNPYFARPPSKVNEDLYSTLDLLNSQPMRTSHESIYAPLLPDGAVTFYAASNTTLRYKVQINDQRFAAYHRNNGITKLGFGGDSHMLIITDGMLTLIDMIHQAFFRSLFNDTAVFTLLQYMPIKFNEAQEVQRLLNIMGASLYPISLSLLMPVFMYAVVLEKEERLQELMKMNGMRMRTYWLVNFGFDYLIYTLTVGVFMLFGYVVVALQFFTQTNPVIMWLLLLGWGISQIALAFFFQVFISKARTATVWGYLLSIFIVLWGITLSIAVYPIPERFPWYVLMYPHFAMARAIYILSVNCGYYHCVETFADMDAETGWCIFVLFVSGLAILAIAMYLNEIYPQEYGVPRHPLFCLRRKRPVAEMDDSPVEASSSGVQVDLSDEDDAVREERHKAHHLGDAVANHPLVVRDLRKVYPAKGGRPAKLAVASMSLVVGDGEMLGLLGPNGAGKTSLLNMLTGLYRPDGGNAWVSGSDILTSLDQVHLRMGVCPQFDILWPELTVEEHLLFYARLKGVGPKNEKVRVEAAMKEVYLTRFRTFRSTQLSGGMRRRLSVAIALVGDPRIIFLDEPTTGLDPENRRQLWDILAQCRQGRAMVLTTHSMEEADVLCSRIAIVNNGVLRCIGPQVTLKSTYGGGYHLFINCVRRHRDDSDGDVVGRVKDFVSTVLPHASLLSEFNGNLVYQVPQASCKVSFIFRTFEERKAEVGISDWGISQSSLEDVFLKVIGYDL